MEIKKSQGVRHCRVGYQKLADAAVAAVSAVLDDGRVNPLGTRRIGVRGAGQHRPHLTGGGTVRLWDCDGCKGPWPCPTARQRLLARNGHTAVAELCQDLLKHAVRDRPDLTVTELFDRFVAWILPPGHRAWERGW